VTRTKYSFSTLGVPPGAADQLAVKLSVLMLDIFKLVGALRITGVGVSSGVGVTTTGAGVVGAGVGTGIGAVTGDVGAAQKIVLCY
jgi:hypothetical protein